MQATVEFIDEICSTCRNLECFDYQVNVEKVDDSDYIDIYYPKVSSKDEDIFPKLTYIKVKIYYDRGQSSHLPKVARRNFTKYLTAKCPNLKGTIEVQNVYVDNHGHSFVMFESCDD